MGGVCPSTVNPVAKTRATDAGAGNTKGGAHAHQGTGSTGPGRRRRDRKSMRRHKRRTLAAGVGVAPGNALLTGSGVDAFTVNALALGCGALMLQRFMGARNRKQALQALRQSKVERRS